MSSSPTPTIPQREAEYPSNDKLIFGLLREIRGAAQHLQKLVGETVEQASNLDAAARTVVMTRNLGPIMHRRIDDIMRSRLLRIEQLFQDDVSEFDWCSDNVQTIALDWLRVMDLWPAPDAAFEEQRRGFNQAVTCLDQIVFQCASLTLSPRVNWTLENLRVGQPLDWDFAYGSELPQDPELRKRLLEELAQEGGVLKTGVVDVDQRVIYKVAQSRAEQRRSAWKLVAFVVLSGAVIPFVLSWIGTLTNQWPLGKADLARLYMTYVIVFVGSGAHVAIDGIKAARAQTRPNFQAVNDWVLWLHVRYISILWSLAWVLLGYILLSVAMPKLELASAFFAGYSIDSITGLFISRFETVVKTKTLELTGDKNKP